MRHPYSHIVLFVLLIGVGVCGYGQSKGSKAEAAGFGKEAKELIAAGEFQQAAQKYSYAHQLDPRNLDYHLGLANAWFFTESYDKAIELCAALLHGKKACPEAFQVTGNCLDAQGKTYEAFEIYRQGLKQFPEAGMLWMEMGIVELSRGNQTLALEYLESGIAAQPKLPSNYFLAARLLFEMGHYAWAAIDAEIFINLERRGDRVREMSALLMQCYEKARRFDFQKAFQWQFCQPPATADLAAIHPTKLDSLLDQAFAAAFTDTMAHISIARLIEIRRFVCHILPIQAPTDRSLGIWDWQQFVLKSGQFEAYHYWLLYDARPDEFTAWFESHEPAYADFEDWYLRNSFHSHVKRPILRAGMASSPRK